MAKPKSIQIMLEYKAFFDRLPDEQAGLLIKGLFAFAENSETPSFADDFTPLGFAYQAISSQVKRSFEKYEEKCRKNSENAKSKNTECKRTLTTANDCDQQQPNVIPNDVVNVVDSENVFGKESGDEKERGAGEEKAEGREKPIPQSSPPSDLQRYAQKLRKEKS